MRCVLVRYKIKASRAAENEALVRGVFEQLVQAAPAGVRYRTLKLGDGVSFVHILEADAGGNPLADLPAFKAFTAEVRERCEEAPVTMEFSEVGAYAAAERHPSMATNP